MAGTHPLQAHLDGPELKKQAGIYVRQLREAAGLTQQELARAVGMDYYTTVSQIERGVTRVPPDKMMDFAIALKAEPAEFGRRLLFFYDPYMFALLFKKPKDAAP